MVALAALAVVLAGMTSAHHIYEKASVEGVGYTNVETIISTQSGFSGTKLVEKESGSGNVITEKTEIEAERRIGGHCGYGDPGPGFRGHTFPGGEIISSDEGAVWSTGEPPMDYINSTKDAEFKHMPVSYSYQTGEYNQKWVEKLCVQNCKIGAVLTETYSNTEQLQKTTAVKTRLYRDICLIVKRCFEDIGINLSAAC
jgi:hypothetical protein